MAPSTNIPLFVPPLEDEIWSENQPVTSFERVGN